MDNDLTPYTAEHLLKKDTASNIVPSRSIARLFAIYNGYRALVAFGVLALIIIPSTEQLIEGYSRSVFVAGCCILLFSAAALTGRLGKVLQRSDSGILALMLFDITGTALISSGSGDLLSAFSALYLITVAAAAVMLKTRTLATLVAALAVLAILINSFWLVSTGFADIGTLLPAGILGSLLFTVSILAQLMTSRLAQAEAQADDAESQVATLQKLNERIIVHMDTGILIVNETKTLRPINAAAQRFLNLSDYNERPIGSTSPELANQYQEWLESGRHRTEPFRVDANGPALIASFSQLDEENHSQSLIFVEDYAPVAQFAQSIKLNSLSQLTASIAHEIRNPLTAIRHAAQLMAESQTIAEADQILCDILVSNSDRVSAIIDNVTEVSRRAAPNPEQLDLNKWVANYLDEYQQQLTSPAEISLTPSEETALVAFDPSHLKRVLSNLLDNALRHSKLDTQRNAAAVRLEVDATQEQVHMDIIDYGHGVSENDIGRLFEPFFTTSKEGSGLGLYLCKDLCEINGAGLFYRQAPEKESTFRVSFRGEAY